MSVHPRHAVRPSHSLLTNERGTGVAEYAIMLGLVAVASAGTWHSLGESVDREVNCVAGSIRDQSSGPCAVVSAPPAPSQPDNASGQTAALTDEPVVDPREHDRDSRQADHEMHEELRFTDYYGGEEEPTAWGWGRLDDDERRDRLSRLASTEGLSPGAEDFIYRHIQDDLEPDHVDDVLQSFAGRDDLSDDGIRDILAHLDYCGENARDVLLRLAEREDLPEGAPLHILVASQGLEVDEQADVAEVLLAHANIPRGLLSHVREVAARNDCSNWVCGFGNFVVEHVPFIGG